ncbi:MAG: repressor LexA [Clostridia bacterium]|nr:repressor LexA [Clostridia bacterium]
MRHKDQATFEKIEKFVNDFSDRYDFSPTMAEIADAIGIGKTTVYRYLSQMKKDGVVDYSGFRNVKTTKTNIQSVRIPVLGAIACGIPKFAEENIEEYVKLPVSLFGQGDYFILRAVGDSMIGASIEDGDLVLIRKQDYANEGQIVVALINNDATLKRFYPEPKKHRVRLHPENPEMDDIITKDCEIQGVAVKVFKDLK